MLTACMWMERKYLRKSVCIHMHLCPRIFSYKQLLGETSLKLATTEGNHQHLRELNIFLCSASCKQWLLLESSFHKH